MESYVATLAEARKNRISNEWTKKTLESLNRFRPKEYPVLKEPKAGDRRPTSTYPDGLVSTAVGDGRGAGRRQGRRRRRDTKARRLLALAAALAARRRSGGGLVTAPGPTPAARPRRRCDRLWRTRGRSAAAQAAQPRPSRRHPGGRQDGRRPRRRPRPRRRRPPTRKLAIEPAASRQRPARGDLARRPSADASRPWSTGTPRSTTRGPTWASCTSAGRRWARRRRLPPRRRAQAGPGRRLGRPGPALRAAPGARRRSRQQLRDAIAAAPGRPRRSATRWLACCWCAEQARPRQRGEEGPQGGRAERARHAAAGAGVLQEGKYELAGWCWRTRAPSTPKDAVTHNLLGIVLPALKQRPQALEAFKTAAKLRPTSPRRTTTTARCSTRAQDYEAAVNELEKAVAAAPDFVPAHLNLGNAYRGKQRARKAHRAVQEGRAARPQPRRHLLQPRRPPPGLGLPGDGHHRPAEDGHRLLHQYRDKGGKDERVDQYIKDAHKGIEKEQRRREREKKDQLRKAGRGAARRPPPDRRASRGDAAKPAQAPASDTTGTPPHRRARRRALAVELKTP